ncbi:MAG: trimethylamine methyltransferase family protein [Anaerolineales bacterium]|nr:trimethylamine methyltransferase family protein [Anaerolineales bacterium]
MKPSVQVLETEQEKKIIQEAIKLLENPGIVISNTECLNLLSDAGAKVDLGSNLASIPENLIHSALDSCPAKFSLYNLRGDPAVQYGSGKTFFNPGSSTLYILDSQTQNPRQVFTNDLVQFVQLVESLSPIDAQSTAMIPCDVPEAIRDLYRLYLALCYMTKPIITGIFRKRSWGVMKELLVTAAGGDQELREKPLGIFDICPTSPLTWSDISCQNILDNARSGIPIQLVAMPMAGATSPVTLAGTVVQHTAECLSGIVLSQLACKGSKIVWGGSAAVFDMKNSSAPMGAPGTWLIAASYAQIGRSLGLPTQAYLGISDAKIVDAQAGMESATGALIGTLAGVNMISGAGMLAYENCQSPEKLILDAEMIASINHFSNGIQFRDDPLALNLIREVGTGADFISHEHTLKWFKKEVHYPSPVIDRTPLNPADLGGHKSAWDRAQDRRQELLLSSPRPALPSDVRVELRKITARAAQSEGMDRLPPLPDHP